MRHWTILLAILTVASATSAAFAVDPESQTRTFSSFGVTLSVPKAASISPSLPQGILFDYRAAGAMDGCSALVIPTTMTAGENAAEFVRRYRATEVTEDVRIDGEPAVELRVASQGARDPVKTLIVAVHGGRGMVITGYGADNTHADMAAEALAATVHFSEAKSPADDAEIGTKNALRFGSPTGYLNITAPEWLRMTKNSNGDLGFAGHDFTQNKDRFLLAMENGTTPQDRSFDDFLRTFTGELSTKYHFPQDPAWTSSSFDPHVYSTQPLGPVTAADGTTAVWRFVIADTGSGRHIRLAFAITDTDDNRVQNYVAATDKMISALRVTIAQARPATPAGNSSADAAGK